MKINELKTKLKELNRLSYNEFMQQNSKEKEKWQKILNSYNIKIFSHYTHKDNLKLIKKFGLLSKNLLEEFEIPYSDISKAGVQDRRDILKIGSLELHDYVPLFISNKIPMMHSKKNSQEIENIYVIIINPLILFHNGVYFTNANAATNIASFYSNNDLDSLKNINWDLINKGSWYHDDDSIKYNNSQKISAEILVPYKISSDWLKEYLPYRKGLRKGYFHH